MQVQVAVIGGGACSGEIEALAEEVGAELARRGAVLVCGGLGGVMAGACRGAKRAGGTTVGILPGYQRAAANPWVDIAVPTGLGHGRNILVVASGDAVIALAGEHGTASEIHLARVLGRPVVACRAWEEVSDIAHAATPREAVARALALVKGGLDA